MNIQRKIGLTVSIASMVMLPLSLLSADERNSMQKVSITNISSVVFTPPIAAICKKRMPPIAKLGTTASVELEAVAEAGDTSGLYGIFEANGCSVVASDGPVLPGHTITLELQGKGNHYLHVASMLLPTNDAFMFTSGKRIKNIRRHGGSYLKSYDAGTEFNDELCANIPGPLPCGGGEGFNEAREDNNFVRAHPGIQGGEGVSAATYNWSDPVGMVRVSK